MVGLHLIPNKRFLSSFLGKRLAIALRDLLIIKAAAQVALIVKVNLVLYRNVRYYSLVPQLQPYLLLFIAVLGNLGADYSVCTVTDVLSLHVDHGLV